MKKAYQKPELYYENFALLESIAGCDLISSFNQASGCVAYKITPGGPIEGDLWVHSDPTQGCTTFPQDGITECYGNPTPGFSIYAS